MGDHEMLPVLGACPLDCPDTCAWIVGVDQQGTARTLTGAPDHPFTAGALCGKTSRYLDLVYGPNRLLHPQKRVGPKGSGQFERIGWDEAIEIVADRLKAAQGQHGPESVLPVNHAGTMGVVQGMVFGTRTMHALGASRLMMNMCDPAAAAANDLTHGAGVGYDPEDIALARLILLWGANTVITNLHQWKFIQEARARGAYVVAIDPLRSDTAARCDLCVSPRPGSDAALALGLMRALVDAGRTDEEWLEQHSIGWPELRARLEEWPLSRVAEVCDLDLDVLTDLADRFVTTRPTAIRLGVGMQRHGGAGAAVRAVLALPAVSGDWRYVGGGVLQSTDGHIPMVLDDVMAPAGMELPETRVINIAKLGEALTSLDDPPVAAVVVFNVNPAASSPDARRVREGLLRDDLFTVVIEQQYTDTCDYADLLLPATTQIEHVDLMSAYGHNYVVLNEPAVQPVGESLPNSEIFRRIARAMGLTDPRHFDSDLDVVAQILDTPAWRSRGVTIESLRARRWIRGADFPVGVAPFANGGFPTASGRVELLGTPHEDGVDPLVGFTPPLEIFDSKLTHRFPLVLLTPASRYFTNSTFGGSEWHRAKSGGPRLYIHPDDACARGLVDDDRVVVHNDRGRFEAEVTTTDSARRGVVFVLRSQWPRFSLTGSTPNSTTSQQTGDMGGAATFYDNRVEVEAVAPRTGVS